MGSLPPGWRSKEGGEYLAFRQLDDWVYAKIKVDPIKRDYQLLELTCDGPRQIKELGRYPTIEEAFEAGDKL